MQAWTTILDALITALLGAQKERQRRVAIEATASLLLGAA